MKKSKKLAKIAYNFALTLYKMTELYPEQEKPGLIMEMTTEAVSICACISTAMELDDDYVNNELLPKAFSATFRIEVMLEISRELTYIRSTDEMMHTLEKIRTGLKEMLDDRIMKIPY